MSSGSQLAGLDLVVGLALTAAESRLVALRREEERLRAILAELGRLRAERAASLDGQGADPALMAGQDLIWQRWVEQRRSDLNAQLARNLVAQQAARADLLQRFGRKEAVTAMNAALKRDAAARHARRREEG